MTEKEKIAAIAAPNSEMSFADSEFVDKRIEQERARKLNDDIEKAQEAISANLRETEKLQESFDMENVEIMPVYGRVLIKPFKLNPFQKVEVKGGLIVDTGGLNPHTQFNPMSGKEEEQDQFIQCGEVVEVGPECKYVKAGDAVFYRKDTTLPVPFFNWGLYTIGENQILATVNVNLKERFA